MPYYKFESNDIFYNRIEAHPQVDFIIYDNNVYYKNKGIIPGAFVSNVTQVPTGHISLYEMNIDRPSGQLIYPFVVKGSSQESFSTVSTGKFNSDFAYGDQITGSYPLSASISSNRFSAGSPTTAQPKREISALRTALDSYQVRSPAYAYSSGLGNKSEQELRLISIPSIFYGSSIEKGTVSLKFYVSGTQIAELKDDKKNGELRQVASGSGADSGSVGGVVMYNEGFIILTGSWALSDHTEDYTGAGSGKPRWVDFGSMNTNIPSSSFDLSFSGTNYIPTLTMLAQAPMAKLNYSNNPTAITYNSTTSPATILFGESSAYIEDESRTSKNIVSGTFSDPAPPYEKTVFISQIGIYDENKNLIATAKLANPVRKRNSDDLVFKLKLDF